MDAQSERTAQRVQELLDLHWSKFSSWEADFITDMQDLEEFNGGQVDKIDELWQKHLGGKNE